MTKISVIPKGVQVDDVTLEKNQEGKVQIKGGAVTQDLIGYIYQYSDNSGDIYHNIYTGNKQFGNIEQLGGIYTIPKSSGFTNKTLRIETEIDLQQSGTFTIELVKNGTSSQVYQDNSQGTNKHKFDIMVSAEDEIYFKMSSTSFYTFVKYINVLGTRDIKGNSIFN